LSAHRASRRSRFCFLSLSDRIPGAGSVGSSRGIDEEPAGRVASCPAVGRDTVQVSRGREVPARNFQRVRACSRAASTSAGRSAAEQPVVGYRRRASSPDLRGAYVRESLCWSRQLLGASLTSSEDRVKFHHGHVEAVCLEAISGRLSARSANCHHDHEPMIKHIVLALTLSSCSFVGASTVGIKHNCGDSPPGHAIVFAGIDAALMVAESIVALRGGTADATNPDCNLPRDSRNFSCYSAASWALGAAAFGHRGCTGCTRSARATALRRNESNHHNQDT
jgi:hypothetical protein